MRARVSALGRSAVRLAIVLSVAATVLAGAATLPDSAPAATPPQLSVTGASLTVASTGQQLFGVNANRKLLIASTTKLMTALVVLQHVTNLSEVFTDPDFVASSVESQIGLRCCCPRRTTPPTTWPTTSVADRSRGSSRR